MNLISYDPFREIRSLQDEMNRVFAGFKRSGEEGLARRTWAPNVDVFENKDSLVLEAELPGLSPDDVSVTIDNNILTFHGERKFEKDKSEENFHRIERSYGSFTRSFTLPPTVSSENVDARFENGMLRVRLAKKEEAMPRQIEIKRDAKAIEAKAN